MMPDRVSNPGPLTYKSGALPIALRGPAGPSPKERVGCMGGAKVLGELSVPGRPTSLDDSRVRAYCACSRCGWGFVWTFFLSSVFSLFFLRLFGRRSDID